VNPGHTGNPHLAAVYSSLRALARPIVPFQVRLQLLRLRRLPSWFIERRTIARMIGGVAADYQYLAKRFRHASDADLCAAAAHYL
jgi:hypothetical protein